MQLFPYFSSHINIISLLGLTLILGVIGGEVANRFNYLPKITGYILAGFIIGPNMLDIVAPSLLTHAKIFVEISLGLFLFSIGKHLDFTWLRHDRKILWMATLESTLTFIFVISLFRLFHFPWHHAALVATIAVATAPAVVLMVADDLQSKGPVTRRTLILTSLNNLFALLLFTVLLPISQYSEITDIITQASYQLFGSIFLGIILFYITLFIAFLVGKQKETQFILLVGTIMFAIGLSSVLKLSSMLTLFILGMASRNLNYNYYLIEIDFDLLAKLFFVLLFVITGIHLQIKGVWEATLIVFSFLVVRTAAKFIGICVFAKPSQLTSKQTLALCFSLTPMAGLAIGMSNIILDFNPHLDHQLMIIVTTSVAMLNIIGPIVVQLAFIKSNEAIKENTHE